MHVSLPAAVCEWAIALLRGRGRSLGRWRANAPEVDTIIFNLAAPRNLEKQWMVPREAAESRIAALIFS